MQLLNWKQFSKIEEALRNSKLLITNTDTVPGIIALDENLIFKAKKRATNKKIIKFLGDWKQIPKDWPIKLQKLVQNFWPGALTIIYNGDSYRMPKHENLLNLAKNLGPLFCSSANLSNWKTIENIEDIQEQFKHVIDQLIVINENYRKEFLPSTIFCYDTKLVIRKGQISQKEIEQFLENC